MTQEERDQRDGEVVWTGGDYVCIDPQKLAAGSLQPGTAIDTPTKRERLRPVGEITDQVWAALPGTRSDLIARTGLTQDQLYSVFIRLRKDGKLKTEKLPGFGVIYHRASSE